MAESYRLCIVTMIGAIDLVGELRDFGEDFRKLSHPYLLRMQSQTQCQLVPMLKGSNIYSGISIMLRVSSILWIAEPSQLVVEAYSAARSGIVKATSLRDRAVNQ